MLGYGLLRDHKIPYAPSQHDEYNKTTEIVNKNVLIILANLSLMAAILTQTAICDLDIELFETYAREFLKSFTKVYGEYACLINFHLLLHLPQFMRDYGPAHRLWTFGFERMNRMLGMTKNNGREPENTMMATFHKGQLLHRIMHRFSLLDDKNAALLNFKDESISDYMCMMADNLFIHNAYHWRVKPWNVICRGNEVTDKMLVCKMKGKRVNVESDEPNHQLDAKDQAEIGQTIVGLALKPGNY